MSLKKDINTNIVRKNTDIFEKHDIDNSILQFLFQNFKINQKRTVSHVHKKKSKLSKENYKSINILQNIFKVYER